MAGCFCFANPSNFLFFPSQKGTICCNDCMLKEAHTISYIRQASHEWIDGDEEEIVYAQATKSLSVVPTDI